MGNCHNYWCTQGGGVIAYAPQVETAQAGPAPANTPSVTLKKMNTERASVKQNNNASEDKVTTKARFNNETDSNAVSLQFYSDGENLNKVIKTQAILRGHYARKYTASLRQEIAKHELLKSQEQATPEIQESPNENLPSQENKTDKLNGTYKGTLVEGKKQGNGMLTWPDGSKFIGFFEEDKAHGQGKIMFGGGVEFEGEFAENRAHGIGRLTKYDKNGEYTYAGEWRSDRPHGKGVETWPDGVKYDGEYYLGYKHGQGNVYFANGSIFIGQFVYDRIEGEGTFISPDLKKFNGMWKNNKMSGAGRISYPDGSSYEGMFRDNMKHGKGTFTWKDGRKLEGNFVRGKPQGKGKVFLKDGRWRLGIWNHGKFERFAENETIGSKKD